MEQKQSRNRRLYVLAGLFLAVMAVFLGVLYDTQVNHYDTYYASSVRSIDRSETVEGARGNITDRNGKVLVSSRSSYNLTFDSSLLEDGEDANEAILRLLRLCQDRGISWADYLPITRSSPFAYDLDSLSRTDKGRFLTYLKDLDEAADALGAYLLDHPSLLERVDEDGDTENPADDILADEERTDAQKAAALLEELTSDQLTASLLEGAGLSMVFLRGGTTGGSDMVARLLGARVPHISMGKLIFAVDCVVILISAFVYRSLESALYAGITIFISSRVIDAILYGTDAGTGKFILIISEKNEEIARDILGNIERGVTRLQAKGGYSGRNGEVLLCAVRRYEVAGVKEIIHAHDQAAFVIVGEAGEIRGEGFRRINAAAKGRKKKSTRAKR